MFCSPGEGGVAMILCRADKAKQYTDRPIYLQGRGGAHPQVRLVRGAGTVDRARARSGPDRRRVEGRVRDGRHRPRGHRRRPAAGHRGRRRDHAHGRERLLRARRAGADARQRRDRDRRPAAGQHRRRLPGQRRADRRLGPAPGVRERAAAARRRRRTPGARTTRRSPTPTSTVPPASAASPSSAADRDLRPTVGTAVRTTRLT